MTDFVADPRDPRSPNHVNRPAYRIACAEVWGGNTRADELVDLPGFAGVIYSKPLEPAINGGDVYYLSVCDKGLLSRVVLADVAGHGEAVGKIAVSLRDLLRKYMNTLDQSGLMQDINEAFRSANNESVQYATAAVLGYFIKTGELFFAMAGHPPALWYHAKQKTWDWLHEQVSQSESSLSGVPLGLIAGTSYSQSAVQLGDGDILVLYTDGITECRNEADTELGYDGLLQLVRDLPIEPSLATAGALLAAVEDFRGSAPNLDDRSVVVLQQVGINSSVGP
jgi:sigma-B regulation protein RsbU (phosphoserine phosphatase)